MRSNVAHATIREMIKVEDISLGSPHLSMSLINVSKHNGGLHVTQACSVETSGKKARIARNAYT